MGKEKETANLFRLSSGINQNQARHRAVVVVDDFRTNYSFHFNILHLSPINKNLNYLSCHMNLFIYITQPCKKRAHYCTLGENLWESSALSFLPDLIEAKQGIKVCVLAKMFNG
jgi:hypothetical protein